MHEVDKEKIKTVVLMDILDLSLPRILSIKSNLESGNLLAESELDFVHEELDKITRCYRSFENDQECTVIYNQVSHLLSTVVQMALENEQKNSK